MSEAVYVALWDVHLLLLADVRNHPSGVSVTVCCPHTTVTAAMGSGESWSGSCIIMWIIISFIVLIIQLHN